MFDEIIKYINEHPLIFALIVLILLLVVYRLYSGKNTKTSESPEPFVSNILPAEGENMHVNQCDTPTYTSTNPSLKAVAAGGTNNIGVINPALPPPFPPKVEDGASGGCIIYDPNTELLNTSSNKMVRFKCTINGKNYYLMVTPISSCTNIVSQPLTQQQAKTQQSKLHGDCLTNVVVLVDEDTVKQHILQYLQSTQDKERVCNFQQALNCNRKLTQTVQTTQTPQLFPLLTQESNFVQTCPEEYQPCKQVKQLPIDFIIQKAVNQQGPQKYLLRGISGQLGIGLAASYYLNQNTQGNSNSTPTTAVLCADITNPTMPNAMVDLITTKVQNNSAIIDGHGNDLRTKISFSIPASPIQVEPSTGKAVMKQFYLGACKNNICTINGTSFARACLFSNLTDPNVLEFQPTVVYYN
jgi:hypothetical protein